MAPENVAPLVVWLGSDESADVTGRVFEVEGGIIGVADGWRHGPRFDKGARWDPAEVGPVVADLLRESGPADPGLRRQLSPEAGGAGHAVDEPGSPVGSSAVSDEPLVHNLNNPVTDGVDRVGIATADGRPFTAVRKVLRGDGDVVVPHWTTADDPHHWNYWRREDLAYTSGTVDAFAADGLRGPPPARPCRAG